MTISLCMIVKNEEDVIGRCLESVRGCFDEIIIVDTGSIDKTKNVCSKYTDIIYDYCWSDDFSAARNFAFSKAKSEYLFWLDADDIIEKEDLNKIIELKKGSALYDTYMFKYVVSESNDGIQLEFYRERLVRNCSKSIFRGFIHECIVPFGRIGYFDIKIKHKKEKAGDPARNLNIFLKHRNSGESFGARMTYYLAKEYFYLSDYDSCEKTLKEFLLFDNKNIADVRDALITLYKCGQSKGCPDVKYLNRILNEIGGDSEALTLTGQYYRLLNDTVNAEMYYNFALCIKKENVKGFIYNSYYYLYPLLELVSLYYSQGKKEAAANLHKILKEKYPDNDKVLFNDRFFT